MKYTMIHVISTARNILTFWFLLAVLCAPFLLFPAVSHAEGEKLTVTPLVFDEKAQMRDILKKNISLTNNTERKLDVYAFVNNIDEYVGEEKFVSRSESKISESLANWIELTPAKIELEPGETKQIPFLIHVSVYATPGIHHAQISFGYGSTQDEAKKMSEREPKATVNVEILDDSKEVLQLGSFLPNKTFFTDSLTSFSYLFENIGNRAVSPTGEIRIYNRRGEEVGAVDVNSEDAELLPNMTSELGSSWDSDGKFGRYKALLDVEYGSKQRGTVQDTIFFWVIPWKKILFMFVILSAVVATVVFLLHRRYELYNEYKVAAVPAQVTSSDQVAYKPQQVASQPLHMPKQQQVVLTTRPPQEPVRQQSQAKPLQTVTLAKRAPAPSTEGNVIRLNKRS